MFNHFQKHLVFCLLFCLLGWNVSIAADPLNFEKLFLQLEIEIQQGNKIALRDLGGFLDHSNYGDRARKMLLELTLFDPKDIDLRQASREDFMAFFYAHHKELHFSDLFWAFTKNGNLDARLLQGIKPYAISATEESKQIALREYIHFIESNLDKDYNGIIDAVRSLSELRVVHGTYYLLQFSNDPRLDQLKTSKRDRLYLEIAKGLARSASQDALDGLLELAKKKRVPEDQLRLLLADMTSILIPEDRSVLEEFQKFQMELVDIETMKQFTYDSLFQFRQNHFEFRVDYLGRILSQIHHYPFLVESVQQDLIESEHPRALYYLSTLVLKSFRNPEIKSHVDPSDLLWQLEQLTGIRISNGAKVQEGKLKKVSQRDALQLVTYWQKNYPNFEWEPGYGMYIDKIQVKLRLDNYERAFRRLSSTNDSVAMRSFQYLIESSPKEVIRLAHKYRPLLQKQNRKIPSLKAYYLEQLCLLAEYCKRNEHDYYPKGKLSSLLFRLNDKISREDRLKLENELIALIDLEDLTILEFHACLYSQKLDVSFSISRILSYLYTEYFEEILKDDKQLTLLLKKSVLFSNLGVSGLAGNYLNQLSPLEKRIRDRLLHLQRIEPDPDIQQQIKVLLGGELDVPAITLEQVLEDILYYEKHDLQTLPSFTEVDFEAVVRKIKAAPEVEELKHLFLMLRLHPNPQGVPVILPLLEDTRLVGVRGERKIEVGDLVVPYLNLTYPNSCKGESGDCMSRAEWIAYWKANQDMIAEWEVRFFDAFVSTVINADEPDPEAVGEIRESPFFEARHKLQLLQAIGKLNDASKLSEFRIYRLFSPSTDLPIFEKFTYTSKQLESFSHYFSLDDEDESRYLVHFVMKKAKELEMMDQGALFNRLLNKYWFGQVIFSGKGNPLWVETIQKSLEYYYNEAEILSAYEEEQIDLNFFKLDLIGKSAIHQLKATIRLQDQTTIKKVVQSIVARVSYEELGSIVKALGQTPMGNMPYTYTFVQKDFGLPVFNLHEPEARAQFIQDHKNLSQRDFYLHVLSSFGVGGLQKDGKIEVQEIYELLPLEIVTPFVSKGGGSRDWFSFGLIKLLELKYNTRLDFHEKLNENQSFYTFTTAKRVDAWLRYLEKNGEINPTRRTAVVTPYTFLKEE